MPERVTQEQLIARNPKIDKDYLDRAHELRTQLQRAGMRRAGYHLASPSTHRRVSVRGDAKADPRIVHLEHRP